MNLDRVQIKGSKLFPRQSNSSSTASQKFRRSLETGRRPFVGPVKSSVGCVVVVGNKGQDAGAQLLHGEATESGKQATNEDREPDLNLVEPGTVSGRVDEANAMAGGGEKGRTGAHAGKMATFAFHAELLLDVTLRSDQTHQRFRLMSIELISDKDPTGVRIGLDRLGDVSGKVGFGARGSNAGSDDLSRGHIQIGDQTLGAVSVVFKFFSLDVTGLHGQRVMEAFKCLNAGHLIGTCHMCACRGQSRPGLIHLTECADLVDHHERIVGGWSQPIPLPMRL